MRVENEYFQRQLDNLRKEVEQTKSQQQQRARSLDRLSMNSKENCNAYFGNNDPNVAASGYEPLSSLPLPVPHPRPLAPVLNEDSDGFHRRDLSSPRHSGNGAVGALGVRRQMSRGSNALPKHVSAHSAGNGRKPFHGRRVTDENMVVESSKDPSSVLEQEIRSLRFELQQQSEVVLLKTETVRNLQEQLESQKRRLLNEAQKVQSELTQDCEALRRELALCKESEVVKEGSLIELKRQCEELTKTRTIEMNLLMNKPRELLVARQVSDEQASKAPTKKAGAAQSKASKNLQLAKDLNAEMELMFADEEFKIRPSKK